MLIKKWCVTLCFVFWLATYSHGEVLDQESYEELGYSYTAVTFGICGEDTDTRTAQTFTVGTDGLLSGIDIRVYYMAGSEPLEVHILPTTGDSYEPTYDFAESLGMVTISAETLPGYPAVRTGGFQSPMVHVDLRDQGIYVSEGDHLAIGLKGTNSQYAWILLDQTTPTPYPQGEFYKSHPLQSSEWENKDDYDAQFRTYVTAVPEPGITALLGGLSLMLCLGVVRSRYIGRYC